MPRDNDIETPEKGGGQCGQNKVLVDFGNFSFALPCFPYDFVDYCCCSFLSLFSSALILLKAEAEEADDGGGAADEFDHDWWEYSHGNAAAGELAVLTTTRCFSQ